MPRNSSGTMSAPAGQPAVSGTTISSATFNTLVGDLTGELSDSLSRSAKGGMLASLRTIDGTVAAPAVAFTAEPASGLYRAAANDVRLAVGGVDMLTPTGVAFPAGVAGVSTVKTAAANGQVDVIGNRNAADANADVAIGSTATRTAGYLLTIQNNVGAGGNKLLIDYNGLLSLGGAAAAIQPASLWTAITPATGFIALGGGFVYMKDAMGFVRLKGGVSGGSGTNPVAFTLPVGFRPASVRVFVLVDGTANTTVPCSVNTDGTVTINEALPPGHSYYFDSVSFVAEQ